MDNDHQTTTWVHRGPQVIQIHPLAVELPMESTVVSASVEDGTGDHVYTINISENRFFRTALVLVSDRADHLDLAMQAWGELRVSSDGNVRQILAPILSGSQAVFLFSEARDGRIGAQFRADRKRVLLALDIEEHGSNADVAAELGHSLKVKLQ